MIRLVFWSFVLFLALSFFGISIQAIINSPAGQENLAYLSDLGVSFWQWLSGFFAQIPEYVKGLAADWNL